MFIQAWNGVSAQRSATQREIDGIACLRALQPVVTALANDESLAVSQDKVDFTALDTAMAEGATAQQQYGEELATQARWTDFQDKVNALKSLRTTTSPLDAFNQYTAVSDQLLDLYNRIRAESGLATDPETDIYYLQDAAARALPAAVISAGQFGDSLVIEQQSTKGADVQTGELNAVSNRGFVTEHADDVGTDVSAAVDATASQTMSEALLQQENAFLDAVEPLTVTQPIATASSSLVGGALQSKATIEKNAAQLSDALLDEIATQVSQRGDQQGGKEALIVAAFVVAALLAAGWLVAAVRSAVRRGPSRRPEATSTPGGPSGGTSRQGQHAERRELERAGVPF